jgi:hypothetical protein
MRLLETGARASGLLPELATGIADLVGALKPGNADVGPDLSGRNEDGRFISGYNERYRKLDGDLGPGFASVNSKRATKNAKRFKISQVSLEVLERKFWALIALPVFTSHGLEQLRAPIGASMEEVCGFPYMPETLQKMLRELKFAGIAFELWEIMARVVLRAHQQWHGGVGPIIVIFYIDTSAKPLWTDKFTKSGKVASNGRVMPCLQAVLVHTGVGVPIYMETFSGRAALLEHTERILDKMELLVGAEVGRIVVIDAEADSARFLKRLELAGRLWVTVLKGNITKGKEVMNRHGDWEYRDGDRLTEGVMDLSLGDDGVYRVRVVEVRHRGTGKVTTVGTCLPEDVYPAQRVANIYHDRWPFQESNIRALKQGTGLARNRGYGKELVENTAVVTELEQIEARLSSERCKVESGETARQALKPQHLAATRRLGQLVAQAHRLDDKIKRHPKKERETPAYHAMFERRVDLDRKWRRQEQAVAAVARKASVIENQTERATDKVKNLTVKMEEIQGQRFIYRNDTELDSLSSLLKVCFAFTIEWVLQMVFGGERMEYKTFLERVAKLKGWYHQTQIADYVVFDDNTRDPEMMALLHRGIVVLNAMKLTSQSGWPLRFLIDSG